MREKRVAAVSHREQCGITPAYAGKTVYDKWKDFVFEDHPRVCGKNILVSFVLQVFEGSPPRMREKPCKRVSVQSSIRITPAYAGKTIYRVGRRLPTEDHPRVCGKNCTVSTVKLAT